MLLGQIRVFFPLVLKWKIKERRETKKKTLIFSIFFDKCFDYFVQCLRFLMVAFKLTFVSVLGQSFSIKCLWAPNFIAIEYHAFENLQGNKIEQQYFFLNFQVCLREMFLSLFVLFLRDWTKIQKKD